MSEEEVAGLLAHLSCLRSATSGGWLGQFACSGWIKQVVGWLDPRAHLGWWARKPGAVD